MKTRLLSAVLAVTLANSALGACVSTSPPAPSQTLIGAAAPTHTPSVVATPGTSHVPSLPAEYAGSITVADSPARDGAIVYARVADYTSRSVAVLNGRYKNLVVQPPSGLGGVQFFVDGARANQTHTFVSGSINTSFNLTVAHMPTATSTPSP